MSKLMVNLFMANTRLLVNTYTVTTLPIYYVIQRPWKRFEETKRLRTIKSTTINGEVVWRRNESPVYHPVLQYSSYAEILQNIKTIYDPNRRMLGHREVLQETTEKDENGNVVKVEGKVLRKFLLSDSYSWLTLNEVLDRVDNISSGLVLNGVKRGDKVVIWADTRLEWMLSSLALIKVNATLTTLFSNLGTSGLIYGINQTEAKTIITSFDLLPKLKTFIKDVPNIQTIIYFKNKNDVLSETIAENISIKSFQELELIGSENKNNIKYELPSDPNETAVIMYTSGTTGTPKAVCISHKQLMSSFRIILSNNRNMLNGADRHVYVSYLPLAHIMGLTSEMFLFFSGIKIGYSSPFTLTDTSLGITRGQVGDAKLLQPTLMTSVPLVLDRILKGIYEKLNEKSVISAPLFTYLMEYKIRWKSRGFDTPIINTLFCKKIKEVIGGKIEYGIVGGAPVSARTHALITAALDMEQISQGYGLTETCGAVIGQPLYDTKYGEIGIPLEGASIKLVDWPDGGYFTTDKPNPRGELVVSGNCVASGYYKLPDLTAEAFVTDSDGIRWFKTGDIGEVYTDGSFRIIDRKKDLNKLSNGEYISIGKIEAALKSCKFVENICVVANSERNYVIGLVTPNQKSLIFLAKKLKKPKTITREELCTDPVINAKVYDCVVESARINNLHKIETPIEIKLCAEEWTSDNKLITAALKLKRSNVISRYENDIQNLFNSIS